MSLLVKASRDGREIVEVTPASAGWTYVGFRAVRLGAGETEVVNSASQELCLVVLTGTVNVAVGHERFDALGTRDSVFDPVSPDAVYVPPGQSVSITAVRDAEVALASSPANGRHPTRLIRGAAMNRSTRGKDSNTRYVCDILPQTDPQAEHLLVVEVITPAGHSSSYPPHKHDRDVPPEETLLEETYYHRINPAQGFAFQRVYTDDRSLDESMAVENHDTVMVPRGYHPCVAPHGYDLYYLNVMAGPGGCGTSRTTPRMNGC